MQIPNPLKRVCSSTKPYEIVNLEQHKSFNFMNNDFRMFLWIESWKIMQSKCFHCEKNLLHILFSQFGANFPSTFILNSLSRITSTLIYDLSIVISIISKLNSFSFSRHERKTSCKHTTLKMKTGLLHRLVVFFDSQSIQQQKQGTPKSLEEIESKS